MALQTCSRKEGSLGGAAVVPWEVGEKGPQTGSGRELLLPVASLEGTLTAWEKQTWAGRASGWLQGGRYTSGLPLEGLKAGLQERSQRRVSMECSL